MTVRNLDSLFRPKSVSVIGASNTAGSVGTVALRNMLGAGFGGIVGQVLLDNYRMLALAETLGFTKHYDAAAEVVEVRLELPAADGKPRP